jgi:hypothetical protein
MSASRSDWRLTNQEQYLQGATLVRKPYRAYSDTWEHDHCEFCLAKFVEAGSESQPDARIEGYATTADHPKGADYHWICPACFDDFAEMFGWRVVDG